MKHVMQTSLILKSGYSRTTPSTLSNRLESSLSIQDAALMDVKSKEKHLIVSSLSFGSSLETSQLTILVIS